MVDIKIGPIRYEKWFHSQPVKSDAFSFNIYRQCFSSKLHKGFIRNPFHTICVELSKSEIELLSDLTPNTRYEINRAKKENILFEIETDTGRFIDFFNAFASLKGINRIPRNYYMAKSGCFVITKSICGDEILSMHSYIIDKKSKIVRLLQSASLYRQINNVKKRALIGMSNRYLHFMDMMFFKSNGILKYDFGGYAFNCSDSDMININNFKKGFGGIIIEQSDYIPLPRYLAVTVLNSLKNGINRTIKTLL